MRLISEEIRYVQENIAPVYAMIMLGIYLIPHPAYAGGACRSRDH